MTTIAFDRQSLDPTRNVLEELPAVGQSKELVERLSNVVPEYCAARNYKKSLFEIPGAASLANVRIARAIAVLSAIERNDFLGCTSHWMMFWQSLDRS